MHDDEVGCVVGNVAGEETDPNGGEPTCSETNDGKNETTAADHPVDES